jgi:hypothetical protein
MRHSLFLAAVAAAVTLALVAPAGAESVTVAGKNGITKMFASNRTGSVLTKVWGLGAPCGGAQHLVIEIRWGTSKAYQQQASCVSGEWGYGLYFLPDRTDQNTARPAPCKGKLTYGADKGFHKSVIGRACIPKAPNRVRVKATGFDFGYMVEGKAGPTKLLSRG